MILYEKPGEVRVTADHERVATVVGTVTVEGSGGTFSVRFEPARKKPRRGWRWSNTFRTARYFRAGIYSAGELFGSMGDEGGWWVQPGDELILTL